MLQSKDFTPLIVSVASGTGPVVNCINQGVDLKGWEDLHAGITMMQLEVDYASAAIGGTVDGVLLAAAMTYGMRYQRDGDASESDWSLLLEQLCTADAGQDAISAVQAYAPIVDVVLPGGGSTATAIYSGPWLHTDPQGDGEVPVSALKAATIRGTIPLPALPADVTVAAWRVNLVILAREAEKTAHLHSWRVPYLTTPVGSPYTCPARGLIETLICDAQGGAPNVFGLSSVKRGNARVIENCTTAQVSRGLDFIRDDDYGLFANLPTAGLAQAPMALLRGGASKLSEIKDGPVSIVLAAGQVWPAGAVLVGYERLPHEPANIAAFESKLGGKPGVISGLNGKRAVAAPGTPATVARYAPRRGSISAPAHLRNTKAAIRVAG